MVDFLGKQDHGVPAGAEVTRDSFVVCARNGGLQMLLADAQLSYIPYQCNPNSHGDIGQCPHQKPCLALRLHEQQAEVLRAEQQKQGNQQRSTVFGEAFRNLHG